MTPSIAPKVDCDTVTPGLPVGNVLEAVDYYTTKLGFGLGFIWGDPPEIAGVTLGDVRVFLKDTPPSPGSCSAFFTVGNADELCEFQRANGVEIVAEPGDREYGVHDYTIRDLRGNYLVFGHYIYNVGPPIEIERVDVPVRLEKRLAALLQDLAAHKGMSLTSTLEETLLHTLEPLGDGVASPHTRGDLRHIQQLKVKHGIDYDSHGSYRFVEKDAG
jgi:catechol 2,3-dioxygenase-like lactoylglutathione lyase family enzyme